MCDLASWWETQDLNSDPIELLIARCSYKWDDVARALPDHRTGERYFKDSELQCVEDDEVNNKRKFREALRKWHGASAKHGLHELCVALQKAEQGRLATEIVDWILQQLAKDKQIQKEQIVQALSCSSCKLALGSHSPVSSSPECSVGQEESVPCRDPFRCMQRVAQLQDRVRLLEAENQLLREELRRVTAAGKSDAVDICPKCKTPIRSVQELQSHVLDCIP